MSGWILDAKEKIDINILSKIEDSASFHHYITHIWLLISLKELGNYFHKNIECPMQ